MTSNPVDRERAHSLMMSVIDGEHSADEAKQLDDLVSRSPDLAVELARLRRLKEVTSTMALRMPPEEVWDDYWRSVFNRTERGIAWLLVAVGVIVVASWGVWQALEEILGDTSLPAFVRIAIVSAALGFLILAWSVVRERFFTRRRDPYEKEVTR